MTGTDTVTPEPATKGERTRQRLLELAIERFGDRGYRATSVSEIARAAGLTQAAAYAYFDNKEALFEAAVDEDAGALIERAHAVSAGTDVHALVPTLIVTALGLLDEHPLLKRVLQGEERDQLIRLINLPALAQLRGWIADEVRAAQADGQARSDIDADAFADGAETMIVALLMAIVQVGSSTEARRQVGVLTLWDRILRPSKD